MLFLKNFVSLTSRNLYAFISITLFDVGVTFSGAKAKGEEIANEELEYASMG